MSVRAAGFTLLEVMIAIVLTGVVALMAIASAQVSAESAAVIQRSLRSVGSHRATRQALLDLLHNVRPPRVRGDTSFALSGDTLGFTAAGAPPLDTEYDWRVAIYPADSGLVLSARTVGRAPEARVALRLGAASRWEVRVLPPGGKEWKDTWAPAPILPSAVAITFWSDEQPLDRPLIVRMSDASSAPAESDYMME